MSNEGAGADVSAISADVFQWKTEIEIYERDAESWQSRGDKIIRRFKDEREPNDKKFQFNLLWSNVQTLTPALFATNPKVNVERRFQQDDDIGRVASMVLERSISYFVDEKFFDAVRQAVQDRLLPGRGTIGIRYKPSFKQSEEITDDEDDKQDVKQELYSEEICIDYLHWKDFGHTFGRTWEEIRAPWKKAYMGREELVERFGKEIGNAITLDYTPTKTDSKTSSGNVKKATIYEIWDKQKKRFIWLHKDYPELLDQADDPLKLKEFFPCPKPLFSTLGNDTIIPVPDYAQYQDQAQELDDLTARIHHITKAVKLVGAYDGSADGLQRMLGEGIDNQLVPVANWAMFAEKGGLAGAVSWLPLDQVVKALEGLHAAREKVKHDLYEISGMSDIIRGDGDSSETATGVKTKGQFATLRLNAMQAEVSRFCRDAVRIMGEIISTHFSLDTIKSISGVQLLMAQEKALITAYQQQMQQAAQAQPMQQPGPPQPGLPPAAPQLPPELMKLLDNPDQLEEMMDEPTWEEVHGLLTNDTLRCFRIDIEVDSTIKADQEAERQGRIEFLEAAGQFIQQAVTIPNPELAPLLMHMLMFGVRGFHIGKELESSFNVALKKLQKAAQNPPAQAPDPELQKVQAQGQIDASLEQMKHQNAMQVKGAELQHTQELAQKDAQGEAVRAQADNQIEAMKLAHDREIEDMKARHEQTTLMINREIEAMKLAHSTQLEGMKHAHEHAIQDKQHVHEKEIKAKEAKHKEAKD